ncbi:hypothetical protein JCM30394_16990 [Deferrisoma palaeochoriense]
MAQRERFRVPGLAAAPVYRGRILPRFCFARMFCLAGEDWCRSDGKPLRWVQWDPVVDPPLPLWLRDLGVRWVVCGGIHPRHRAALEAQGLEVAWGYRGPAEEALRRWARGEEGELCVSPGCRRGARRHGRPGRGTPRE